MRKGDRLRGRGEAPGAVVETYGSGETGEVHVRRDDGDDNGLGRNGNSSGVAREREERRGEGTDIEM